MNIQLGIVPPPLSLYKTDKYEFYIKNHVSLINTVKPHQIGIYDIQDEKGRNGSDRPFKYIELVDNLTYAIDLKRYLQVPLIIHIYRSIKDNETIDDFFQWMKNQFIGNFTSLVIVGNSKNQRLKTDQVILELRRQYSDIRIGCILIPERYNSGLDESQLLFDRTRTGVSFFTSQIIYDTDLTIMMLENYYKKCMNENIKPADIFLTFAPISSSKIIDFMEWLGVYIPNGTKKRILSKINSDQMCNESLYLIYENINKISFSLQMKNLPPQINFVFESLSKSINEQNAIINLFSHYRNIN